MRAFRLTIAVLIAACAVPVLVLALIVAIAAAGGCSLHFETDHTCTIGNMDAGWLIDRLIPFGTWSGLAAGLAVYLFALWILTELITIVLRAVRRR